MHRTTIYLPDQLHADLELLAYSMGVRSAELIRYAVKTTFRDEFEVARANDRQAGVPKPLWRLQSALKQEKYASDGRFRRNRVRG